MTISSRKIFKAGMYLLSAQITAAGLFILGFSFYVFITTLCGVRHSTTVEVNPSLWIVMTVAASLLIIAGGLGMVMKKRTTPAA